MNTRLLHPDVRAYLLENIHTNAAQFVLKSHPFTTVTGKELAQQLVGLQKAQSKFGFLFENTQILFPPKENLEQTSSWSTAQYKAALIKGTSFIDLTGGYGIDTVAFAAYFKETTHIEINPDLQPLAARLFEALDLTTTSHCANGMDFLKKYSSHYDLIYLDPSRKTAASAKAVLLDDYEPRVLDNLDLLIDKGHHVLLKTSPMLDITAGMKALKKVKELHIVAVKNEVKELLWILSNDASSANCTAVNLETTQPAVTFNWMDAHITANLAPPSTFLYEPNAALMKSQAFGMLGVLYDVTKLDNDAHLFSSNQLIEFPGRTFRVEQVLPYKPKDIKKRFAKSGRGVVARNFRESVTQLRTKFNLKESETDYLFFTTINGTATVIEATKLN